MSEMNGLAGVMLGCGSSRGPPVVASPVQDDLDLAAAVEAGGGLGHHDVAVLPSSRTDRRADGP